MNPTSGLRGRLVATFAIFGVILAGLYGGLIYSVFHDSEDAVQARLLRASLDSYLLRSDRDADVVRLDRFVTVYRSPSALPPPIRSAIDDLNPGIHEIGEGFLEPDSAGALQVLVADLDDGSRVWLTLDTTSFEADEQLSQTVLLGVATAVALVAIVGAALGATVARAVVSPVVRLSRIVEESPPAELPERLARGTFPAEVGVLADALSKSTARVRSFAERERQFTSNASHELRTPLTVIRGAAELLEARPEASSPGVRRPLERIRRSVERMQDTIELFLLLAREDVLESETRGCSMVSLVDDLVDHNRRLLGDRPVEVRVEIDPDAFADIPERVASIVIGNLVRNAFQRTEAGHVLLAGDATRLTVSDTGPGMSQDVLRRATQRGVRGSGQGYGLGLFIVAELCARLGWSLEIDSVEGEGTRATVFFS